MKGGGGWRERAAAKQKNGGGRSNNSTSGTTSGIVLRVSRTGFGFVGATQSSRQRYHFTFQNVVKGDANLLKVGDAVTYDTRMNDETMEKEAFNVSMQSSSSTSYRRPIQQQTRNKAASTNSIAKSIAKSRQNQHVQHQVTKDKTDQFGNQRVVQSGALLDIIDGENNAKVAASCDDFDINPTSGIGFSIAYQRSRGKIITPEEEKRRQDDQLAQDVAALEEKKQQKDMEKAATGPSWRRRGQGGGSRSLADMM